MVRLLTSLSRCDLIEKVILSQEKWPKIRSYEVFHPGITRTRRRFFAGIDSLCPTHSVTVGGLLT
jgi:hypothetical protein